MARDDGPPAGVKPMGRRRAVDAARVAARVAGWKYDRPVAEGVQPLNSGFFLVQRMRGSSAAKARGEARAKVKER